jgi:hypothetical protein
MSRARHQPTPPPAGRADVAVVALTHAAARLG